MSMHEMYNLYLNTDDVLQMQNADIIFITALYHLHIHKIAKFCAEPRAKPATICKSNGDLKWCTENFALDHFQI